jgi:opacity protein-like surface antigen
MKLLVLCSALAAAVAFGAGAAAAAAPVPCSGTVQLTAISNLHVSTAGPQTFVEFDFTGLHDICLADGSLVTATVAGHLTQRQSSDGDPSIRFDETASYAGGTLGYRGEASLANGSWQSHVQTVGEGTGVLGGIHGQGSFWFTGPTSLADQISYVYS